MKKVELESTNQKSVGNVNDSAYMPKIDRKGQVVAPPQPQQQVKPVGPAIEKKYDWYQNNTHLFISYKVSSPDVQSKVEVSFTSHSVDLVYEGATEAQSVHFTLELANEIEPSQSTSSASAKKIELKLKKVTEGANWMQVEKGGQQVLMATS